MNASAPTRGDKATIGFGLLNVPVVVYNGVDENAAKITRKQFGPSGEPVKYVKVDSGTGEELAQSQIALKYQTSDGSLIDLSDEEIAAAMGEENGSAELIGIFPMSEFGKYRVAGPVQVRPQTTKVGSKTSHPFDKAYALFFGALVDNDSFALVKYTTRGKPKIMAVYGEGQGVLIHWENEVRAEAKMPEVVVTDAEMTMATKLLQTIMGQDAPVVENDAVEAVRTYAEAKAAGVAPETKPVAKPTEDADDLMALLEASLASA